MFIDKKLKFDKKFYNILCSSYDANRINELLDKVDFYDDYKELDNFLITKILENDNIIKRLSSANIEAFKDFLIRNVDNVSIKQILLCEEILGDYKQKIYQIPSIKHRVINLARFSENSENKEEINLREKILKDIIYKNEYKLLIELYDYLPCNDRTFIEDIIIKTNDAKYMFLLALSSKISNTKLLINKIKETNDYEYIIKSAIYLDKSLFNEIFMIEDLASIIELINLNEEEKNIIYSNIGEIYIDSLNISKNNTKGYKK